MLPRTAAHDEADERHWPLQSNEVHHQQYAKQYAVVSGESAVELNLVTTAIYLYSIRKVAQGCLPCMRAAAIGAHLLGNMLLNDNKQ